MTHLQPVTWSDVATKRDIDHAVDVLRADLRGEFRSELHQAIAQQTRWLVTFMVAWSTVVIAAVRLLFP